MADFLVTKLRVRLKNMPDYPAHDIIHRIQHGDSACYIVAYNKDWEEGLDVVQEIIDEKTFLDSYDIIDE